MSFFYLWLSWRLPKFSWGVTRCVLLGTLEYREHCHWVLEVELPHFSSHFSVSPPGATQQTSQASLLCCSVWVFLGKQQLGSKLDLSVLLSIHKVITKIKALLCYIKWTMERKLSHCTKCQLGLLVSHRSKTPQNKIALPCNESWMMLGQVSEEEGTKTAVEDFCYASFWTL